VGHPKRQNQKQIPRFVRRRMILAAHSLVMTAGWFGADVASRLEGGATK